MPIRLRAASGSVLCLLLMPLVAAAARAAALPALSLAQALLLARQHSPELRQFAASVEAARAGWQGARAPANPRLRIIPWHAFERPDRDELEIGVPLEVFGQRGVRTGLARAGLEVARGDYRATELDVVRDVKQAYAEVLRAQASVALNQQTVTLAQTLAGAAQQRLAAGDVPGSQVIQAKLQVALAQQDLAEAQRDLGVQKARLNTLLGRDPGTPFTPAGRLTYEPAPVSLQAVRRAALARRPELASAQAQVEGRRQQVKAARLERLPEVEFAVGKDELSSNVTGLSLGLSLPLFDFGSLRNQVRQNQAQVRAQEAAAERTRQAVLLDVQEAYLALGAADAVVRKYRQEVLGPSGQLLDMARTGYQAGATSYLELLEAQRTYVATHTKYLRALATYAEARAALERAAGGPLPTAKRSQS